MVLRVAASVACLAVAAQAFLPAAPACRGDALARAADARQKWRVMSTVDDPVEEALAKQGKTKPKSGFDQGSWDEEKPLPVFATDKFVLQSDVKDWAELSADEQAKVDAESAKVTVAEAHSTFVPHNHPFAFARVLNVVSRVADLAKTTKFYEALGLIQLRDKAGESYSSTIMGLGSEEFGQNVGLQFVQEGSGSSVDLGDGYMGVTLEVPDVAAAVKAAEASGGKVLSPAATLEFPATQVPDQDAQEVNAELKAVVADPDGYKVTLIQAGGPTSLKFVTLRVFDQEQAVAFYNKLGMKLLYKRANVPVETSMSAGVGYDDDHVYTMGFVHPKLHTPQFHMFATPKAMLELKYVYDSKEVRPGSGLANLVVGVYHGVTPALEHLRSAGAKVLKEASNDEMGEVAAVADVDGYTVTLVNIEQFNALLM